MTPRYFGIVFLALIGLMSLLVVWSSSFDFMEFDTAEAWAWKYFSLPIFILSTAACIYTFLKVFKQQERKETKSILRNLLEKTFMLLVSVLFMSLAFINTTRSLIILSNAYIGESKTINLQANIVDYYTLTRKWQTHYYIKIQDQQLDKIIVLEVKGPYELGQTFNKTMQIGKWGLLYAKN